MDLFYLSDTHLEFLDLETVDLKNVALLYKQQLELFFNKKVDPSSSILILAGDIVEFRYLSRCEVFFRKIRSYFYDVYYVAGNHEYWSGVLNSKEREERHKETLASYGVRYFNNEVFSHQDYVFIFSTLFGAGTQGVTHFRASKETELINDFRKIKYFRSGRYSAFKPQDYYYESERNKLFVRSQLEKLINTDKKVVVVTHHLPAKNPLDAKKVYDNYYHSDILGRIGFDLYKKPDLWIVGHLHTPQDFVFNEVRVVSNPCFVNDLLET